MASVKDKLYANYLETIGALKHEVQVVIDAIKPQTIENSKIGLIGLADVRPVVAAI